MISRVKHVIGLLLFLFFLLGPIALVCGLSVLSLVVCLSYGIWWPVGWVPMLVILWGGYYFGWYKTLMRELRENK